MLSFEPPCCGYMGRSTHSWSDHHVRTHSQLEARFPCESRMFQASRAYVCCYVRVASLLSVVLWGCLDLCSQSRSPLCRAFVLWSWLCAETCLEFQAISWATGLTVLLSLSFRGYRCALGNVTFAPRHDFIWMLALLPWTLHELARRHSDDLLAIL